MTLSCSAQPHDPNTSRSSFIDRVAGAHVQATRPKASAPDVFQVSNTRFSGRHVSEMGRAAG